MFILTSIGWATYLFSIFSEIASSEVYHFFCAVRELNGARTEASVRAYGGAGQSKVSNKWVKSN